MTKTEQQEILDKYLYSKGPELVDEDDLPNKSKPNSLLG